MKTRAALALLMTLFLLVFSCAAFAKRAHAEPPVNKTLPVVVGEAVQGGTLETSNGTWTPEGSIFGYSWERCNTSGAECVYEGEGPGFNSKLYGVREVDVGHTIRSQVSDICGGFCWSFAKSEPTAIVKTKPVEEKRTNECLGHEVECGFPSKATTGPEPGAELKASSGVTVSTEGQTIQNLKITGGGIQINASHTHIKNVEIITANLKKPVCEEHKITSSTGIIRVSNNVKTLSDITIDHVDVHGPTEGCPELGGNDIENSNVSQTGGAAQIIVTNSRFYNSPICFKGQITVENSYCDINGVSPGAHYDGNYLGSGSAKFVNDTILMPHPQTAPIAVFDDFGVIEELTVEKSLLAGGGYIAYGGLKCATETCSSHEKISKAVKGPVKIINNRLARCTLPTLTEGGGYYCEGYPRTSEAEGYGNQIQPPLGWWPKGGFFGTWLDFDETVTTKTGNVWDDNGVAVP